MKAMRDTKIRNTMSGLLALVALALCGAGIVTAQQASTVYRPTSRDPFVKPKPPVRKAKKAAANIVEPPSIQSRIENYKQEKLRAMNAQLPAPKPTTALLLSEFQVIGIFRTPRGYAAMVEATPIKLSYTIYPGETFYDGQLVAIEENRLTFRRETRFTNGQRTLAVEMKPLRQPSVADQMTSTNNAPAAAPSAEPQKNKSEPSVAATTSSPVGNQN
ncbi:hypothetical protein BH18ACI2_BH18ACI2_28100 [soil metagenome]